MDTERLRQCAHYSPMSVRRKAKPWGQHVIEQPTRRPQFKSKVLHSLMRFVRNTSLCLFFLLESCRVGGQQSDFQPLRLAGAQRHQPVLAPLPLQLGPRHHDNYPQHPQQLLAQRQLRQQHYQRSVPARLAHLHHQSDNLSPPSMKEQDHRASKLMASLNERVYKINQHHQQRRRHELRQPARQTKSLEHLPSNERHPLQRPNSNRRASSSAWSPNHVFHDGHQTKFRQLQADAAASPHSQRTTERSSTQIPDADGKLLICYYTTRHTAPYWPKEGREFIIPADRLGSLVAGSGPDMLEASLPRASSVNVGSFNDRYPNYQRAESRHTHSKYSERAKVATAGGERRQMILVSPNFVPSFNRTQPAADTSQQRHGPLAQLLLISPTSSSATHHHEHSISSRQDNLPMGSTSVGFGGPTSAQNNGPSGAEQRQQRVSEAAYSLLGPPLANGTKSGAEPSGSGQAKIRGVAGGQADRVNNGDSDAVNFVQTRRQPQSMDTSLASSSSGAPISASSLPPAAASSRATGSPRDSNNELHATSPPSSPNVISNNYYYHYNNNNNNHQAGSPTTTVSFPTSTSSVQSGLNIGSVNLQRAKSLQMAESELSPALQLGVVSSTPVAQPGSSFSPLVATAPPSGSASSAQQQSVLLPQQHQHEQQLLKIQGLQMVPVGQAAGEQKATTSLVLSGPSSTMLSLPPMATSSGATSRPSSPIVLTSDNLLIAGMQHQQEQQEQHHHQQQQPQHDAGSLSSTFVGSPLSTVFDVFGAASQYLMRFKPSSLISPAAFASNFNTQTGLLTNLADQQRKPTSGLLSSPQHHKTNSSSLFSGAAASFISFPFSNGLLSGAAGGQLAKSIEAPSERATNSTTSKGGFLSRLALHSGVNQQQQQQQQQRREDICGRTIQTPERRIIGGEGAKYGEFPYQVHIKIAKHQCGGALVDRQSIVTAAHCVYHFITRAPVSKLQIVIGAYDIEDEQYQELPPQYFKVNKVKLHPNFRFSASHPDRYDIAILKLDKPVKYTDNVLPVCLPGKDLRFENMVGTVTGFGKTDPSLSNRYGTRLLQKVDVPIIENNECERWHRTRGIDLKIFPEMMCAGYEDGLKDACVGDSGGPLVIKTPVGSNGSFRWTLAGITSAGFGCAQSRQPGIYHRVSHTVDWILENLD